MSACTSSACTSAWKPLTVTAVPSFGPGVNGSMMGDLVRPDGSHQLTYGGHPLYTYSGDTASGQTNGERVSAFGGTWYVISAATGAPVTSATGNGTTSTTSGYGY